MRQIKFRVWNGQQMEYDIMAGLLGAFYVQGIDENDSASMSPFNTKYFDDTPLMQFAGLLDKKEKEIYEGDIIRKGRNKFIIEFRDGGFEMVGIGFVCVARFCSAYRDIEVIGNIYENPELLEDKK